MSDAAGQSTPSAEAPAASSFDRAKAVPLDHASRAMLLATFVTRAVQISMFEVPVVMRTRSGGEPRAELERQRELGFERGRYTGLALGALVFLVAAG